MKRLAIILLLCLFSLPAQARGGLMLGGGSDAGGTTPPAGGPYSFTFVGSAYGAVDTSSTTVETGTVSIAVQSGDLIIAAVQWEDDANAEVTVAGVVDQDSQNAADAKYTEVHNGAGTTPPNAMNLHVWWGIVDTPKTITKFSATIDTSLPYKKMTVLVYRPSGGTVSLDIAGTPNAVDDTDSSQIPLTGSFSVAGDDSVVCAVAGFYTSGTWDAANTTIGGVGEDRITNNSGQAFWCLDNAGPLTSVTATSIYSTTRYWVATAVAFKAE